MNTGAVRAGPSAILGALCGAGLALLLWAPARWLEAPLQRATAGRLQMVEATGAWWRGQTRLSLSAGAGSGERHLLPGMLRWRTRPGLQGGVPGVRLELMQSCCMTQPVTLWLGWERAGAVLRLLPEVHQTLGVWPALWLAALGTPWNTVIPGGQLSLHARAVSLQPLLGAEARLSGELELWVVGASSRLSPLPSLGSYRLVLGPAPGPGAARWQLHTLHGPLQLRGEGGVGPRGLHFSGEARAEPGHEAALDNLLNLIGRRDGARSILSVGRP